MSFAKFREAAREGGGQAAGSEAVLEPHREGQPARSGGAAPAGEAIIGAGTKIVGKLSFEGPAQIDGQVDGEITSKDKLVVGEGAVVNAKVTGSEIWIKGTVSGDIVAGRRLALQRPARIIGNISAPSLSIEEGVVFEGSCKMNTDGGSVRSGAAAA